MRRFNFKNYYANDPKEITAKFEGKCKETGLKIFKGQKCIYYPMSKSIYHLNSKQATEFYNWKFDNEILGYNY